MAITQPNEFPWKPQSDYVDLPNANYPGDCWEGDLFNERNGRGLIAAVTPVSQVTDILIGANNPTDDVGVYIDGALFNVAAGADADATALLLQALLQASTLLASIVDTVTVNAATVTVTFADDQPHIVTEYSPAATTATVSEVTASVGQQRLLFGYGVVRQTVGDSANFTKVIKPTSVSDMFAGVLMRTPSSDLPPEQIRLLGYDADWLCPGYAYTLALANFGVVVQYVGSAPTMTDPVYLICTGADAGKWRIDDGSVAGTSQVSTLTMTSVADGNIGFSYDGLPSLAIAATGNATNDATSLYGLYLANASYMAITTGIVDNLDGTLTITFADDQVHTFANASTGTSSVAENIDTAAIAGTPATAKLIEHGSWGRPSITTGDTPRAFLRLSNP